MEKIYIDSNIFIYAVLNQRQKGEQARTFLQHVGHNKMKAYTSVLTYDEVCWKLIQHLERKDAEEAMNTFLSLPNLIFIDTTQEILEKAHSYVFKQRVDPRDSIHLASKKTADINTILTEDTDFKNLDGTSIDLENSHKI